MLRLFNSLGRRIEPFRPVDPGIVTVFTCGPSVYQRAHIGNFRTFLFQDILVRYLEFRGLRVSRGMNFTDIEDKAIDEAKKRKMPVKRLTGRNIGEFLGEMELLRMRRPDFLPKASECVEEAVEIINDLIARKIAYWHRGNVYFDPLKFKGFGRLFGLDMTKWPKKKRRFHRDTYPGVQWNLGDFILWHGFREGDKAWWDTAIGRGRPSWNIQDPSMILRHFQETLSIYCGGIDNLYRHHDYTLAVLESVRPHPMARCWLHCRHLHVDGRKMSKSRGNIVYTDMLLKEGYGAEEIRFFLINGHYREQQNFTWTAMKTSSEKLMALRARVGEIGRIAGKARAEERGRGDSIKKAFTGQMDDDMQVERAFNAVNDIIRGMDLSGLQPEEASSVMAALRDIDGVLQVIFPLKKRRPAAR